jgi:fimbrial isopeptide formation D2 family protein
VTDTVGGCDSATPPNCAGNNTSSATIDGWAVTVSKGANPASGSAVLAGQTITYTVTATVTGGATTQPVVLQDTLSTGLTFGTVTAPGVFVAAGSGNTRTATLPIGTVAGSYSVSYTATVDAGASGTVSNVVSGASCQPAGSCTTSHPVGAVNLAKALASENGSVAGIAEAGETLTYTLTLTNPSTVAVSCAARSAMRCRSMRSTAAPSAASDKPHGRGHPRFACRRQRGRGDAVHRHCNQPPMNAA